MNRERLDVAIQKIRDYTMNHKELCTAHRFLFDLPLDKEDGKPEVVMMGINPGETEWDRQAYPGPTDETWSHDFHEKSAFGRSQGSNHWRRNAAFFANGKRVVFTELFFWSSNDKTDCENQFKPSPSGFSGATHSSNPGSHRTSLTEIRILAGPGRNHYPI